ncbi:MAG: hypothetical protein U0Y68_00835 [Blastocatellia bacterium]
MKRMLYLAVTAIQLVFVFAAASLAQSVAGDWQVTLNSPQGSQTSNMALKQEGDNLSGALKNERGELPVKGTIKGSDVTIKFTVKFQDNDFPITLTGKLAGNDIKGDADFGGLAQGDWSAKRAGEAASAAAPAKAAASASGATWDLTYTSPVGEFPVILTVQQDGENISGIADMKGQNAQKVPFKGTLKGDNVEFKLTIKYEGNDLPITSKGTVSGGEVKGRVDYGGMAEGEFKGKKH